MSVIQALIPVFLCIAVGYGFRHHGKITAESWNQFGNLTYFLLMPALQIHALANAKLDKMPWAALLGSILLLLLGLTLLLVLWQRWVRPQAAPTFSSLYQGSVRFNTFIALVLGSQLFGSEGLAAVAIVAAVMILFINVLCVLVFAVYVHSAALSAARILRELATNPLILGCVIGLALNFSGLGLSGWAEAFFRLLGNAALPVGLMVVGAALQLHSLRGNWEVIMTASLLQLLLKPLLALGVVQLFGLQGMLAAAVLICFSVPTSPSAYVLALQKGGDSPTMAAIITLQTLFAALTVPLIMNTLAILGTLSF